jgi:N-dimethylarginine dimethylaminohydrolase
MNSFGAQDMVAPLRRVMMKRPGAAMANADPGTWHYAAPLSLTRLRDNHDAFVKVIGAVGAEVLLLDQDDDDLADAVFTCDPSLVTDEGAVILRMGKGLRRREPEVHRDFYARQGIPILGVVKEPGTVEAGDCLWLDAKILAVGLGFRTNEAGLNQVRAILSRLGVTVSSFDLPFAGGAEGCLHLMSLISLLDYDLALVHLPLLPVRLHQLLSQRRVRCLAAPPDEYTASRSVSVNALAWAPRRCVMIDGFPKTAELVRRAGCDVVTFAGDELCLKAEGGPTCLTRPILRKA